MYNLQISRVFKWLSKLTWQLFTWRVQLEITNEFGLVYFVYPNIVCFAANTNIYTELSDPADPGVE